MILRSVHFIRLLLFRFEQHFLRAKSGVRERLWFILRLTEALRHSMDITSFPVAQIGTRTLAPPHELRWGRSTETPTGKLEEVMMIS